MPIHIRKELLAHLSAGLISQVRNTADNIGSQKAHIYLQCPERGALYFLDEIVEDAGGKLGADIVRLDYQDLHELLEDLLEPLTFDTGFQHSHFPHANIVYGHSKNLPQKEENSTEENEDVEDDDPTEEISHSPLTADISSRLLRLLSPRVIFTSTINSNNPAVVGLSATSFPHHQHKENKISAHLDAILSAATTKRLAKATDDKQVRSPQGISHGCVHPTIIYLRELSSLLNTTIGQMIHQTLVKLVNARRRRGESIILVVSDDFPSETVLPSSFIDHHYHLIKLPSPTTESGKTIMRADREARVREINLRSLQHAIRQRCSGRSLEFDCPAGIHLDAEATSGIRGLNGYVWDLSRVQRIASVAIGSHCTRLAGDHAAVNKTLTVSDISQASEDIEMADQEAAKPLSHETQMNAATDPEIEPQEAKGVCPKFHPLSSKECNKHEQKLLSGVIDPGSPQRISSLRVRKNQCWVFRHQGACIYD